MDVPVSGTWHWKIVALEALDWPIWLDGPVDVLSLLSKDLCEDGLGEQLRKGAVKGHPQPSTIFVIAMGEILVLRRRDFQVLTNKIVMGNIPWSGVVSVVVVGRNHNIP